MARKMNLARISELVGEAFSKDANGPKSIVYGSEPPTEAEAGHIPDYSMPLFLAEEGAQSRSRFFGIGREWDWNSPVVRSWVIKAGITTAAAAAIAFAIASFVPFGDTYNLFADAKGSLMGMISGHSDSTEMTAPDPVVAAVQSAGNGQSLPFTSSTVGVRTGAPMARGTPMRGDAAFAMRSAPQGEMATGQLPDAAPSARSLDAGEIASLVSRAKGLIGIGDIMAARLLLERAADGQDADAALLLAQTYDPAVLGNQDARTIVPDPLVARSWYERAAALGSVNAQQRLAQMQN
jgi:hypothetical protein